MKKILLIILLFFVFGLSLAATGCGSQNSAGTSTQTETGQTEQQGADYQDISSETLKQMMSSDKDLLVVDVREKVEWDDGHIDGSQLVPISEFQARVNELPKDKKIVLLCLTGSRSSQAAAYMVQLGYTQIYNLNGGLMDWPYELVK